MKIYHYGRVVQKVKIILGLFILFSSFALSGCTVVDSTNSSGDDLDISITKLRIDGVENSYGIDNKLPSFSWQIETDIEDFKQFSYRIFVYKSDILSDLRSLVWDSGEVKTDKTNGIHYEGDELTEHTKYVWFVEVTDCSKNTRLSDEAEFTTAYWSENAFEEAAFITMNEEESVYYEGLPIFYKEFKLSEGKVKKAVIYASALGIYDAYLNGERIGKTVKNQTAYYEELKPGWSNYSKTLLYNTYDITEYLNNNGENTLAVMVGTGWWCGRVSQGTYGYNRQALIAEIHLMYEDGSEQKIVTDETWRYIKDTAVVSADIYNGEIYNANMTNVSEVSKMSEILMNKSKADTIAKPVCEVDPQEISFTGSFKAFYGYNIAELKQYERTAKSAVLYSEVEADESDYGQIAVEDTLEESKIFPLHLAKGESAIIDLGQNMTGVPYLRYTAPENAEITLNFAEMLNDTGEKSRQNDGAKGSLYKANYRSAESKVTIVSNGEPDSEYQTAFSYFGFRYIEISASEDMIIEEIKGIVIGNTSPESGNIETDHAQINRLFSNIKWSQQNNFMLVATDCPQRDERLGWTGDVQVYTKSSLYNQDLQSFYKKWIWDCMDSQREDGAYTDTVPYTIVTGSGNAGWADAGVSVPYYLYMQYGELSYIQESYDSMNAYMAYLESISDLNTEEGRAGPLTAFGDWLSYEETDQEFISAIYYARDARMMAEMAHVIGNKKEETRYTKLYKRIKKYFNKRYVKNNELTVMSQTACLLTLSFDRMDGLYKDANKDFGGFVDKKTRETIIGQLVHHVNEKQLKVVTGFLGTVELLPVLTDTGNKELAYKILTNQESPSWMAGINQGATTIWERFDSYTAEDGFNENGMNSFNHFVYGSVAEWMYESMLGIKVNAATGEIWLNPAIIFDKDAPVKKCEGFYNSIYGKISVKWETDGNNLLYEVTVPPNAAAKLYIETPNEKIQKLLQAGTHRVEIP